MARAAFSRPDDSCRNNAELRLCQFQRYQTTEYYLKNMTTFQNNVEALVWCSNAQKAGALSRSQLRNTMMGWRINTEVFDQI
jgi:hypothetical protein